MDDFIRAILTMIATIIVVLIVMAIVPPWFNSINSHELVFTNTTGVFH